MLSVSCFTLWHPSASVKCNFEPRQLPPSETWRRLNDVLWLVHFGQLCKRGFNEIYYCFLLQGEKGKHLPHKTEYSSHRNEREREREIELKFYDWWIFHVLGSDSHILACLCVCASVCMHMCVCSRLCVFLSAACSVCKCTLKYMHCVFNPSPAALGGQIFCIHGLHFLWYVNTARFQIYSNYNPHMYIQSWCNVCLISF